MFGVCPCEASGVFAEVRLDPAHDRLYERACEEPRLVVVLRDLPNVMGYPFRNERMRVLVCCRSAV